MALPDSFVVQTGTPIILGVTAAYAPTARYDLDDSGTGITDVLDLISVAAAGAEQSAKFDFGANRAPYYAVHACVEMAVAATAGGTIDFYISPSWSATAGTGNAGNSSGASGAYTGTTSGTVAESVPQLQRVGSLVATPDVTTNAMMGWV